MSGIFAPWFHLNGWNTCYFLVMIFRQIWPNGVFVSHEILEGWHIFPAEKILANYKLSTKSKATCLEGDGVLLCATVASNFAQSVILLALTKLLVIIDVFIQNKILLLYRFLSFDYIQKCKKSTFSLDVPTCSTAA